MENLITITTNEKQQQVVDARELHKFLGSKQEFAHWIKAKVVNNPFFTEGEDYVLLDNSNKQTEGRGGSNRIDYALTLDTAKKVSMAEQTDKGNEVRDYFIECEKIAKQPKVLDFNDPDVVLQLAQNWKDEKIAKEQALKLVEQKEKQLETQKPLVLFAEAVNNSNDLILIGDFAKSLGIKNFGRNKMFDKLKELKILMKNRMPYQQYIDSGVFVVIENESKGKLSFTTRVTGKGQAYLTNRLKKERNKEQKRIIDLENSIIEGRCKSPSEYTKKNF